MRWELEEVVPNGDIAGVIVGSLGVLPVLPESLSASVDDKYWIIYGTPGNNFTA